MYPPRRYLVLTFLAMSLSVGLCQDPIDMTLIRPEVLIQASKQLQLSPAQLRDIRRLLQEAGPKTEKLQQKTETAKQQLAQLLRDRDVQELDVQEQFKKVAQLELETRELSLLTRVRLGKKLSNKQFRMARQLSQRKLRQTAMQQRSGPSFHVATRLPKPLPGTELSKVPMKDLLRQLQAMKKKDVAWRKVQWRTCLIEGLRESKKQSKPVMLWVFIDRPIDDERC